MGLDSTKMDRATVVGPRLDEISAPRRMREILLPRHLPASGLRPEPQDVVLIAGEPANVPLRCTVSCMGKQFVDLLESGNRPFVDTSRWEMTAVLENDTHFWTWTLRASRDDEHVSDRLQTALLGPPKWGRAPRDL